MTPSRPLAYLLPYVFAAVFPLVLGVFVRGRNRAPVGRSFQAMLLEQALWAGAVLLEILSTTLGGKAFWDDLQFLASGIAAVLSLSFALRYEGTWFAGGRRTWWLLMGFPCVSWTFAATASLHGLHRADAAIDASVPFGELVYSFRAPMLLLLVPLYAIAFAAVIKLGLVAARHQASRRMGALAACIGLALPLAGTVITIIGVRIHGRLDASSLWIMAGDVLVAIGVLRYRMAAAVPVARRKIVEGLRDPVIVIGRDGLVVDHNEAIRELLGPGFPEIRGHSIKDIFSSRIKDPMGVLEMRSAEAEVTIRAGNEDLEFSMRMFPVIRDENARILVFRDITALKAAERSLRGLSAELERTIEARVLELETEIALRRDTEARLSELNAEMGRTRKEVMFTLSEVVENRGKETARHVARVSEYCRALGRAAGLAEEEAELLANASAMHDIGKIAVPDSILLGREALGGEELGIMRSHTRIGARLLSKSDDPLVMAASRIALEHHERWDGSGYPDGKKGADISLHARIVGMCDVFDSLLASRPYRKEWEIEEILRYFRSERGKAFDPALVDLFFSKLDDLLDITVGYRDDIEDENGMLREGPA